MASDACCSCDKAALARAHSTQPASIDRLHSRVRLFFVCLKMDSTQRPPPLQLSTSRPLFSDGPFQPFSTFSLLFLFLSLFLVVVVVLPDVRLCPIYTLYYVCRDIYIHTQQQQQRIETKRTTRRINLSASDWSFDFAAVAHCFLGCSLSLSLLVSHRYYLALCI